tara:strand:- start:539 stop:823 length:285 start_codon:yes stop_codon:yes gene_type:complete
MAWFFVGFVKDDEFDQAREIAESYKCKIDRQYPVPGSTYANNAFRVSSIRNKLWGHRWATSCDWLTENPELADFDPNVKVKSTPRKTLRDSDTQ